MITFDKCFYFMKREKYPTAIQERLTFADTTIKLDRNFISSGLEKDHVDIHEWLIIPDSLNAIAQIANEQGDEYYLTQRLQHLCGSPHNRFFMRQDKDTLSVCNSEGVPAFAVGVHWGDINKFLFLGIRVNGGVKFDIKIRPNSPEKALEFVHSAMFMPEEYLYEASSILGGKDHAFYRKLAPILLQK